MAVTDLTNTKWLFNNSVTGDASGNITFISNGNTYTSIYMSGGTIAELEYGSTTVGSGQGAITNWINEAYKTIEITGGTDATNSTLIAWLEANATQVVPTGKTQIGTRAITKKMFGTREITKEVVNGVVVYEKQVSGYDITCSIRENYVSYKNYLRFYDGQNTSGTLLYESVGAGTYAPISLPLTSTTGYIYVTTVVDDFGTFGLFDGVNCTLTEVVPDAEWLITFTGDNATCTVEVYYGD